jgi:phenylacetate-CoA ligase
MDAYAALFRSVLHPAWETVLRGRPTLARLELLRKLQWRSSDELVAFQVGELRKLVRHAGAHVPYYRDAFAERGVSHEDLRSPDDMRHLPLLTRDMASSSFAARKSQVSPLPTITKTTSGSSGNPLCFAYDEGSEYWRQATKLRGYEWAGYRPGDEVLHYWGPPPKPLPPFRQRAKMAIDRALRREHYVDCVTQNEAKLLATVDLIRRRRPKAIVCYAQSGGGLARFIVDRRLRDWGTIPVICGAEPLLPNDRAALRDAFGPAVFDTYGCRETMLMATECDQHDGLHVCMENILLEVLVTGSDGRTRHAEPGEVGEVVITDLHNFGAPLIRYKNGDLARWGGHVRCSCGRAHPKISAIEGRVNEAFVDGRGGRVNGMYFCTIMVPMAPAVKRYQAIQHKDRSITLKLVPTERYSDETTRIIRRNLEAAIPGVPLSIELVAHIAAAESGKGRPVVVEV